MGAHRCFAKYLGKADALEPKVGTLENTARIYQKGCLNIDDSEYLTVVVNSKAISIRNENGMICIFPIKSTLFCATYKKLPQVVAFNYLSSTNPPVIECHALYMDSALEAKTFVEAVTAAFNTAYEIDSIGSEAQSRDSDFTNGCHYSDSETKKNPWMEKVTDVFRLLKKKVR